MGPKTGRAAYERCSKLDRRGHYIRALECIMRARMADNPASFAFYRANLKGHIDNLMQLSQAARAASPRWRVA